MKLNTSWSLNLKTTQVQDRVAGAARRGLLNVVILIANQAIRNSPHLTGNNKRSIKYELGPNGLVATEDGTAAIYSTSGYGGYLETGTVRMGARPYMKPALDAHFKKLPGEIKRELEKWL